MKATLRAYPKIGFNLCTVQIWTILDIFGPEISHRTQNHRLLNPRDSLLDLTRCDAIPWPWGKNCRNTQKKKHYGSELFFYQLQQEASKLRSRKKQQTEQRHNTRWPAARQRNRASIVRVKTRQQEGRTPVQEVESLPCWERAIGRREQRLPRKKKDWQHNQDRTKM